MALNHCIFRESDGLIIESRKPILPHGLEMIIARSLVREHGVEQSEAVSECRKAASHFQARYEAAERSLKQTECEAPSSTSQQYLALD